MDYQKLQRDLERRIDGDVYTDTPTRLLYSTDASIYQVIPTAIVCPRHDADVVAAVQFASEQGMQIHARGAGSAIGGQCLGPGMVIDFTGFLYDFVELDPERQCAWTRPGIRYADFNRELESAGLYFPPDPSSGNYCTIGGMVANNTSGAHSIKYGITGEFVRELRVVLRNGEHIHVRPMAVESAEFREILAADSLESSIYRQVMQTIDECRHLLDDAYPDIRYNVSGYNLRGVYDQGTIDLCPLFTGSEGTLGVITHICLGLLPIPAHSALGMAMFKDIESSGLATVAAVQAGAAAVELLDNSLVSKARDVDPALDRDLPDELDNVLMIEFDGDDVDACARELEQIRHRIQDEQGWAFEFRSAVTKADKERLWAIRKAAVPLANKLKGDAKAIGFVEDAAVPIDRLVEYYQEVYACSARHDVQFNVYGHAGKGLLHVRPILNLKRADDIEKFRAISQELFEVVERLNGTPCGEHGDGRPRSRYIQCLYPDLFPWFLRIKEIFDPERLFNPDVKTNTDDQADTSNLRYGSDYQVLPDVRRTLLNWAEDGADYQAQIEMCHGCSTCTTPSKVYNMCPVYKVRRQEKSAPKAKANILRHLIQGRDLDPAHFGASAELKAIMDECISCQSCHLECVSNVNIPKLAIEAKARYVARNGQTFQNRVVTRVAQSAAISSALAPIVNPLMQTGLMRKAMEATVGLASERTPIRFQKETTSRFATRRRPVQSPVRKVAYFTGCAANYMQTDVGKATIAVLEHNSVLVEVPKQTCCGLPKLTNGSLPEARLDVLQNAGILAHYVRKGYDIITSCTSCDLSLKEEWRYSIDNEDTALVARNTYQLSEYLLMLRDEGLLREDFAYEMPPDTQYYSYHSPCHLRVAANASCSARLLELIPGLKFEHIQAGCCGMSGSWGMKKQNYQTSLAIGEDLKRAMQRPGTDGITDCPTCRLQIQHLAEGRDGQHPAVVLADAYRLTY